MCDILFPKSFFTTRNGSIVWITKGRKGSFNGVVIQATEKTRRRFPVGTKVVYQNSMGHVMCKGEEEEGKECVLHPLDAVHYEDSYPLTAKGKELLALTKKVQEKFKDREVLLVTKASPKAVQKKPKAVKSEKELLTFKDLKAGEKYTYPHSPEHIFQRNSTPLKPNEGSKNRTVIEVSFSGRDGWELPDTPVIRVA